MSALLQAYRNEAKRSLVQEHMIGSSLLRGVVVIVAVSVLTGCTLSSGSDPQPVDPTALANGLPEDVFAIPTSEWQTGDGAMEALLNANLYREGTCLVAGSARNPTAVIWPQGFTAFEDDGGIVSVKNADGVVVAQTGQTIVAGGGSSVGTSDFSTEAMPAQKLNCIAKYTEAFLIQDAMTTPLNQPDTSATPSGRVVTTPEALTGKWFATELYGRTVKPRKEDRIPVPYLVFAKDPAQAAKPMTWSTNDGCNTMAGQYTVLADGTLDAKDGWSTLVGCPPVWSMHGANIQALTEADQALIQPPAGTAGTAVLTLMSKGEVIGVYETTITDG